MDLSFGSTFPGTPFVLAVIEYDGVLTSSDISVTVSEVTGTGATFSFDTITSDANYMVSWMAFDNIDEMLGASSTVKLSGKLSVPTGEASVGLTFSESFSTAPYVLAVVEYDGSLTDSDINVTVSNVTTTGADFFLDTVASDGNYKVSWMAFDNIESTVNSILGVKGALPTSSLPVASSPGENSYTMSVVPDPTSKSGFKTVLVPFSSLRRGFLREADVPASQLSPGARLEMAIDGNFIKIHDGVKWGRAPIYFGDWNFQHHISQLQRGKKSIPSAATSVAVAFDEEFSETPIVTSVAIVYKGTGPVPLHQVSVSDLTTTGFTATISPLAGSANLELHWEAQNTQPEDDLYNPAP